MGVLYEIPPMGGLIIEDGQPHCFELPFPSRAYITKLIVAEVGTQGSFTAALFNAPVPCEGGSLSEEAGPHHGGLPAELYRVCPEKPAVNGVATYFADDNGGLGYLFFNQEKTTSPARLGVAQRLYLRITPSGGAGLRIFAVTVGGDYISP